MTVLTDIEAIINSRPLSYVGDDIRDGRIITPALLAIGRDLGSPRMHHQGKQKFLSRSALGISSDFKVTSGLFDYVNICRLDCSTKVDQGRDTIEAKRCRTHIRGQHAQREMETWENRGHLSWKRWTDSHSKGPNQERNVK